MRQYLDLMDRVLSTGVETMDRTGTGTLSVFGEDAAHRRAIYDAKLVRLRSLLDGTADVELYPRPLGLADRI